MIKQPRFIVVMVFLLLQFSFNACKPCDGTTGEPLFRVNFVQNGRIVNPGYNRVYGIDHNDEVKSDITFNQEKSSYDLPVSVITDKVIYIFEQTNQPSDTLIVDYNRRFELQDSECGMEIFLDNVRLSNQSTFTNSELIITTIF